MNNFNVNGFLQTLEQNQPKPKEMVQRARSLEKLYLSFPGNYGKYQVFPMNSTVTGYPFAYLNGTREIKVPRKNIMPDGTENVFEAWTKILPDDAYRMLDSTGRIVSSLTTEDENLLIQARTTFDALYEALGGNQKDQNLNKAVGHLRRRNYTVFHGKCLNKWSLSDPRTPERQNFAALFVCTAKGFSQAISDNISDGTISHGGDNLWLEQIYNRQLEGRGGYLIFSIAMGVGGKVGYTITATHESDRAQYLNQYNITEEEADMMQDPVESFLGWQAGKEPGKLFNKALLQETIAFMSEQLAAVRMAQSTGVDVLKAMEATTAEALKRQTPTMPTNDPMLAQQQMAQGNQDLANPGAIYTNNTNPYSTPPAAQIDPVTQNPVAPQGGGQQAPYTQPGFAKPAFGNFNPGATTNQFGGEGQPQRPINNPFQQ